MDLALIVTTIVQTPASSSQSSVSTEVEQEWEPRLYIIYLPPLVLVSFLLGVVGVAMLWFRLMDSYYRKKLAVDDGSAPTGDEPSQSADMVDGVADGSRTDTVEQTSICLSPDKLQSYLGTDRSSLSVSTGIVSSSCKPVTPCSEDDVRLRLRLDALCMALEKYALPRSRLIVHEALVYGPQEMVRGAQLLDESMEPEKKVLVKSLIQQGNLAKREHLLKEALLLSSMTHYNVLSLEGVCLDIRSDMWLVTDIPALGDLKAYLRNAAKVALNEMVTPKQCVEQQLQKIQVLSLLDILEQVASGMAYLESRDLVHGDLSARNCLIMSDTPRIVIGDLGISKTVYANDYYAVSATVTLPVRWMAPELLLNTAQYSIKTDVWAFGITAWEIFALGRLPYAVVQNLQVTNFVALGNGRLPPVRPSPENFCSLLMSCWHVDAEKRPSFQDICVCLWSMNIQLREDLGDLGEEDEWEQFKEMTSLHVRITADIWDSLEDGIDDLGFWTDPSGAESMLS